MEGSVNAPGPATQVTLEFNPATGTLSFVAGDARVFEFVEQRLGSHPIDKPAALAEEIVAAKENADVAEGIYYGTSTLRDIAVAVSYGVLDKDTAVSASRRLLERQGLLDAVAEAVQA